MVAHLRDPLCREAESPSARQFTIKSLKEDAHCLPICIEVTVTLLATPLPNPDMVFVWFPEDAIVHFLPHSFPQLTEDFHQLPCQLQFPTEDDKSHLDNTKF